MATNGNIDYGYITLGGSHTIAVEQYGKEAVTRKDGSVVYVPFHEYAYVQASAKSYYNPRMAEIISDQIARKSEQARRWLAAAAVTGLKWCSQCGDERPRSYFSPDKRNFDGLDGHCKGCRAEHKRMMYRLEREAQGLTVRDYKRRQPQVIEVDFGGVEQSEKAA